MSDPRQQVAVEIPWVANITMGDRFEKIWLPVAEAVLDYGATWWALFRSQEGMLNFTQWALFPKKIDWERYWYSEEVAAARAEASGLYQVPVLPVLHRVSGMGVLKAPAATAAEAQHSS